MDRLSRAALVGRWRLLVLLLVLVPMGAGQAGAGPSDPVPSLLEAPASGADAGATPGAGRALRSRRVAVRLGVLVEGDGSPRLAAGGRIGLNLFDDARFVVTVTAVTRHGSFGHTWSGRLEGVALGHAVLAVHDGAMVGVAVLPGVIYRIGYAPDGTQVVEEIDPATLPAEADPPAPAVVELADGQAPETAADSASQIDLMVVYTTAARTAAGGTSAMLAEVALAVASANEAYANSGLAQRVRLVFAGETALGESGNFNTDLSNLRLDPTVARLRDMSRADLVSLITSHGPSPAFCGIGYLMQANSTSFAPFGLSVVDRICASANLTFAHELGHNMGAHHDPFVAGSDSTLFPYSHGHVDLTDRFRTIMAYDDQCQAAGFSCTRIEYFSTPTLTYNGRAIGNASTSDNARTLGQTGDTVARFRQALTSPISLAAGVNQPSFAAGQTLVTSVGLDNPGIVGAGDIYIGLVLPGGTTVFFTGGGYVVGTLQSLASFRPIAAGVPLATPFAIEVPGFFSYRWSGSEPRSGFVFFVLLVRAGGLAAGLTSDQVLGAAMTAFSFP